MIGRLFGYVFWVDKDILLHFVCKFHGQDLMLLNLTV
jgi:hypothetical protein